MSRSPSPSLDPSAEAREEDDVDLLAGLVDKVDLDRVATRSRAPRRAFPPISDDWPRPKSRHDLPSRSSPQDDLLSARIEDADHQELEKILEELEDHTAFAEARLRRLALRLPKPPLGEIPAWFSEAAKTLTEDNTSGPPQVLHSALGSAANLVRALAHLGLLRDMVADLSPGPRGAVDVSWGPDLSWTVYPPAVGWPIVHVRVYGPVGSRPRTLRLAQSVLSHFARANGPRP